MENNTMARIPPLKEELVTPTCNLSTAHIGMKQTLKDHDKL